MTLTSALLRLEFRSAYDMLELVQGASDHIGRLLGFDEDALMSVGLAVREAVINAIKHGNRDDERKRVFVEFAAAPPEAPPALLVQVRDQGEGFDPTTLADPGAEENLLKTSGRGLLLIRGLMDDVVVARSAEGGTELRMLKRLAPQE